MLRKTYPDNLLFPLFPFPYPHFFTDSNSSDSLLDFYLYLFGSIQFFVLVNIHPFISFVLIIRSWSRNSLGGPKTDG